MDNIKHLIAAYFYELWDQHEYSSWEEAVDDFVARSPERAASIPGEIEELVSAGDNELADQLAAFGLDYLPPEGHRAWLCAVSDRIRPHAGDDID